jgi:sulfur carrier protein
MVEVSINRQNMQVPGSGSLADVLEVLGIRETDGIAIAVNEEVIPKGEWKDFVLQPLDKVFVIRATQGG